MSWVVKFRQIIFKVILVVVFDCPFDCPSSVNRTYELSGITHMTPFHKYGTHSTGPSTYRRWVRTYNKLSSCKSVLMVRSYRAQSNEICTHERVSRGSLPRVRRYGLLYLRTVEYDQWLMAGVSCVKLPSYECQLTLLISQHWFR